MPTLRDTWSHADWKKAKAGIAAWAAPDQLAQNTQQNQEKN